MAKASDQSPLKMSPSDRKKITVISKYASENFTEGDWLTLGQISGKLDVITSHPRLFRAMSFGDDDYDFCVAQVVNSLFEGDPSSIPEVIDNFDVDLWYKQKSPEKYARVFLDSKVQAADFWKEGYLRAFVSHLSSNKRRMSGMKAGLDSWGISAFIAHEDIEATREWRDEVEAALETADFLIALVEPGFKESDWCAQEVGYALGRKIDIVPLRAGLDPFGFFGKFQGISVKGKIAVSVADEIAQLLLKKPKHRDKLLQSMKRSFLKLPSKEKIRTISMLDSWSVATDEQIKEVLEQSSLSDYEKNELSSFILRVGAFRTPAASDRSRDIDDEIPF